MIGFSCFLQLQFCLKTMTRLSSLVTWFLKLCTEAYDVITYTLSKAGAPLVLDAMDIAGALMPVLMGFSTDECV
jgi:hypothetical protein